MKPLIILMILFFSLPLQAEAYRIVHPDGSVEFTDVPQAGAEDIKLRDINTYQAPAAVKAPTTASPEQPEATAFSGYKSLSITSPKDGSVTNFQPGGVTVSAVSEPPLQPGHRLIYLLDGEKIDEANPKEVFAGKHRLEAEIRNESGKRMIRAKSVSFTVSYPFLSNPNRQTPPLPGNVPTPPALPGGVPSSGIPTPTTPLPGPPRIGNAPN